MISIGEYAIYSFTNKGTVSVCVYQKHFLHSKSTIFILCYFTIAHPVHARAAYSLFQPIYQLLIQYLDPPETT